MKPFFLGIFFLLPISAYSNPTPWEIKFNNYIKGLPNDVVELLKRTDNCNHWGGEVPYDKDRTKEINEAMKKSKCNFIEADTKQLTTKYKNQPQILDKINKFSEL